MGIVRHHEGRSCAPAVLASLLLAVSGLQAQAEVAPEYREPPAEITALLTATRPPEFRMHPPSGRVAQIYREAVTRLDRVMQPRIGLAGFRFDPQSRTSGLYPLVTHVEVLLIQGQRTVTVWRPKDGALLDHVQFSPDGHWLSALAYANGSSELRLFNVNRGEEQLVDVAINPAWGDPCRWATIETLLCRVVAEDSGPAPEEFSAPMVIDHEGGASPERTYPNLLKNAFDDELFEHYFSVGFARFGTDNSVRRVKSLGGLIKRFDPSPDGRYVVATRIERPFSRLLPARRFPSVVEVWDLDAGIRIYESDAVDRDGDDEQDDRDPPRRAAWKPGSPVTLGYIESSDEADGNRVHRWMELTAPFTGERREVVKSDAVIKRFGWTSAGTPWYSSSAQDGEGITVYASVKGTIKPIWSGEAENLYENPGRALTVDGADGPVLEARGIVFLAGDGRGEDGPRPFLDAFDFASQETLRVFEAPVGVFERVLGVLDAQQRSFVTVRETEKDAPRLFVRQGTKRTALTTQFNPYTQLDGVTRKVLHYERADGIDLSGTLYLPATHRKGEPLPTLVWIYPYEFTDREQAEMLDLRAFRYHQVKGPSPLAAVVAGYAVLMNPTVPIMYEGSTVNDTYLPQLVSSLDAAVKHLVSIGVSDPARIAVGGRSYGSFSSANLLIHSDLFATAICMSGAYNRTLTPFGFQHERRSFWEAGEMYANISPFFHADKVKKPILFVHGGGDENAGTPPMQARRFVHALIGQGATVRYVELPQEGHHYWARENVLLASAEMLDWLDWTIGPKRAATKEAAPATSARP